MTRQLGRALELDELELNYQPIVRLDGSGLVGAEALLRWRHPDRGLLTPGAFLDVAEQSGLIGPIGEWVIAQLARQARTWAEDGFLPDLSFNVSLRQLQEGRFIGALADRVSECGLEPERLVAEITESAAVQEPERVECTVTQLHALGVRVAIDDFGAGLSSLGRLERMPVDVLKLDRSFLTRLEPGGRTAEIIRTIGALAAALGMETIVEGVETEAQRALLPELGWHVGQGFLLGRPMPADRLPVFAPSVSAALRLAS
jgi:EAL domain-containing protein (putative c-di-GMP-specific phosphodiesterase class I)